MSADSSNATSNAAIGARIQALCKAHSVTQSKLQRDLGFSKSALDKLISGETGLSRERLLLIADYFNVSTDYLLGRKDYATRSPDLAAACDFTGLSERVISLLSLWKDNNPAYLEILNDMLVSPSFSLLLWQVISARSYVREAVSDVSSRPPIPTPITYNQRAAARAEAYANRCGDYAADVFSRFLVDDMVNQFKATLLDLINYSDLDAIRHFGGDSDGK